MAIDKTLLKKLLADGVSMDDIQTAYNEVKAEAAKEEAKKAEIAEAKEDLAYCFMSYLEALDVINEKTSDEDIEKYSKLIDKTLDAWETLFTKGKVSVSTSGSVKYFDPLFHDIDLFDLNFRRFL